MRLTQRSIHTSVLIAYQAAQEISRNHKQYYKMHSDLLSLYGRIIGHHLCREKLQRLHGLLMC